MHKLSEIISTIVVVLFFVGTVVAVGHAIGHPARYIEQPQRLGVSVIPHEPAPRLLAADSRMRIALGA